MGKHRSAAPADSSNPYASPTGYAGVRRAPSPPTGNTPAGRLNAEQFGTGKHASRTAADISTSRSPARGSESYHANAAKHVAPGKHAAPATDMSAKMAYQGKHSSGPDQKKEKGYVKAVRAGTAYVSKHSKTDPAKYQSKHGTPERTSLGSPPSAVQPNKMQGFGTSGHGRHSARRRGHAGNNARVLASMTGARAG